MRAHFLSALLLFVCSMGVSAQERITTGSLWSHWYVQAGLDMSLQNPYGYSFSKVFPRGKTFGLDVAVGKWVTPQMGIRLKANWENGFPLFENHHAEWVAPFDEPGKNMDKHGYLLLCGDVQFSLRNIFLSYDSEARWNMIAFARAGLANNFGIGSNSPMVGAGLGATYRIKGRLSAYADMAYQLVTSEFTGGATTTGMSVSSGSNGFFDFNIGVQIDLGKSKGKF